MGSLDKRAIFLYADQVLGLDLDRVDEIKPLPQGAQALLDARVSARAAKDWKRSDDLRDELKELGLEIKDGPDGQSWSWL
jgi:cysteinyl-tRNA synthetase